MRASLTILLCFFCAGLAHAKLLRENLPGVRPAGMGNAFLALSDDANAPWYNPAYLARVKGAHLHLIDLTVGADSKNTLDRMKNAAFDGDFRNLVRPDTQFMHLGVKPTFVAPYFAFGVYENFQGFFDLRNLTSLDAEVDLVSANDLGAIAAVGIPAGDNFSFGIAVRGIQRSGVDAHLTAQDLLTSLSTTQTDFLAAIYDQASKLAGLGWGIGLNVGGLFKVPLRTQSPRLQVAATVEDVGQTTFRKFGTAPTPKAIKPSYNLGAALTYTLSSDTVLNLASDLRHNFEALPFFKTFHFGAELRHRIFGVRGGLYQGNPTYGVSLEFPPHTRLHAASYAVELGDTIHERSQRWYVLQVTIGFNPF